MNLLERIVADKQHEVARSKQRLPLHALEQLLKASSLPLRNFKQALEQGFGPNVIAEVKRASPSKGVLRPHDAPGVWQPDGLAKKYEEGGAKALSVLTDVHYFWGHPDALLACKMATTLPVLRKDFMIDLYQVAESRFLGADAILLIARILTPDQMQTLATAAFAFGMDVLVEVHQESELEAALNIPQAIVGVNNRDLNTLKVDVQKAANLRQLIPQDRVVVAESGLSTREEIKQLQDIGIKAFLIGETLVKSEDPKSTLKGLLH